MVYSDYATGFLCAFIFQPIWAVDLIYVTIFVLCCIIFAILWFHWQ